LHITIRKKKRERHEQKGEKIQRRSPIGMIPQNLAFESPHPADILTPLPESEAFKEFFPRFPASTQVLRAQEFSAAGKTHALGRMENQTPSA